MFNRSIDLSICFQYSINHLTYLGSLRVYEGAFCITFSMHDIDFPFLGLMHFEARLHVGKSLFCRPFFSLSLR